MAKKMSSIDKMLSPSEKGVNKDAEPVLPRYILHPSGKFKMWWDTFAVIILIYAVCCAPLRLGFDVEDYCPSGIWVFEALVDICFIIDLILNFITAVYVVDNKGDQQITAKLGVIAKKYLTSWFAIDVTSSAPIDLVTSITINGCTGSAAASGLSLGSIGDTARMVRILRLVKLLKVLRILRLGSRFAELGDRAPILNAPLFKLLQPLFCTVYFAHIISCGFYAVGADVFYSEPLGWPIQLSSWLNDANLNMPQPECDPNGSFASLDPGEWRFPNDLSEARKSEIKAVYIEDCGKPTLQWEFVGSAYVAALYWTFTTITTVGYGDLAPKATIERGYAIFAMFIGTGLFGYIISAMTNTLSESFKGDAQMQMKFKGLQEFMSSKDLPWDLKVRIRRHFRYLWSRSITLDVAEAEILAQLSTPLRAETLRHMHRAMIQENPIFSIVEDPTFRDALIRSLRPLLISPTEVLIDQGTVGEELYILSQGTLSIYFDPKVEDSVLVKTGGVAPNKPTETDQWVGEVVGGHEGSIVGEVALLPETGCEKVRTSTVLAKDNCELYSLNGVAFLDICRDYPAARKIFADRAKLRLAKTNKMREETQQEVSSRLRQVSGSLKARKFGMKLQIRAENTKALANASPEKSASPALSERDKWGGLVKWHRQGEYAGASPEEQISMRLEYLEGGQVRLEKQLQTLTRLLEGGLTELRAAKTT